MEVNILLVEALGKVGERFSLTKKTLQNFADNKLSLCTVIIKINNECRLE